jgi:hypothetical protein
MASISALAIAERGQRLGHAAVDDLEIAAAGQLLELDQGEVGLDAGGVAIHHQADGAGGRDHGGLGIAEAMGLAERQRLVPGALGGLAPAPSPTAARSSGTGATASFS